MITKSLTKTSTKEIMQIMRILNEFISNLQHRYTSVYFKDLILEAKKKVIFLDDFLQKRLEATRQRTVSAFKEIHCICCHVDFEIPLKAVLSGSGYVKYYRDDSPHECPTCGWREVEGQGMIIIRFNE